MKKPGTAAGLSLTLNRKAAEAAMALHLNGPPTYARTALPSVNIASAISAGTLRPHHGLKIKSR
jgi:hypothetical protein